MGEISKRIWFAGDEMSGADVMMKWGGQARPKIAAFLERIHQRPAYRRALAKGGAYAIID